MNPQQDFHLEFEHAKHVIHQAGLLLKEYAAKGARVLDKKDQIGLTNLSTEADGALEKFIRGELEKKYSQYGFIGEEGEASEGEQAWIVDPLDGTMAFSRQIPEFGIALAFKSGREVIFSVQYIPTFEVLLTAYKGEGAFANGEKLEVGKVKNLDQSLISVGFQNLWNPLHREHTFSLLDPDHAFRAGHSSVVESYYFASGKTDVLVRFDQKIWDTAAECLLMEEAGGIVTDEFGQKLVFSFTKDALHNFMVTNSLVAEAEKEHLFKAV
jgi:myo-inositol-1(or 4)-monophosphatase